VTTEKPQDGRNPALMADVVARPAAHEPDGVSERRHLDAGGDARPVGGLRGRLHHWYARPRAFVVGVLVIYFLARLFSALVLTIVGTW